VDREALRARLGAAATRPPDALRGFAVPTLFITGADDIIYPPFLSDALAPLLRTPPPSTSRRRALGLL